MTHEERMAELRRKAIPAGFVGTGALVLQGDYDELAAYADALNRQLLYVRGDGATTTPPAEPWKAGLCAECGGHVEAMQCYQSVNTDETKRYHKRCAINVARRLSRTPCPHGVGLCRNEERCNGIVAVKPPQVVKGKLPSERVGELIAEMTDARGDVGMGGDFECAVLRMLNERLGRAP